MKPGNLSVPVTQTLVSILHNVHLMQTLKDRVSDTGSASWWLQAAKKVIIQTPGEKFTKSWCSFIVSSKLIIKFWESDYYCDVFYILIINEKVLVLCEKLIP